MGVGEADGLLGEFRGEAFNWVGAVMLICKWSVGMALRSLAFSVFVCCVCVSWRAEAELIVAAGDNILSYDTATNEYLGVFASGSRVTMSRDVAFGPDGNLYVNSGGSAIYRFDGQTGALIDQLADSSTSPIMGAYGMTFRPEPVPEPSTLATLGGLLAMGLIGCGWRRRKRAASTITQERR